MRSLRSGVRKPKRPRPSEIWHARGDSNPRPAAKKKPPTSHNCLVLKHIANMPGRPRGTLIRRVTNRPIVLPGILSAPRCSTPYAWPPRRATRKPWPCWPRSSVPRGSRACDERSQRVSW